MITIEEANKIANESIQQAWKTFMDELHERALDNHAKRMGKPPTVEWRSIRGGVGGLYYCGESHPGKIFKEVNQSIVPFNWKDSIEMNTRYLYLENEESREFVKYVALHELGHCLNYRLNKRRNHDKCFRAIMRTIGGSPDSCHNFNDPPLQSEIDKMYK